MTRPIARVLIDSPLPQLDRLFDYAIPEELTSTAVPGVRVKVPFRSGGRVIDGFIVEVGVESDSDRALSSLETVVSSAVVMPADTYALARAVADRAAGSAIDVLRLAVPKRQARVEKAFLAASTHSADDREPPASVEASGERQLPAWMLSAIEAFPNARAAIAEHARVAVSPTPGVIEVDGASVPAWTALVGAMAVDALDRGESSIIVVPDYRDLDEIERAIAATGASDQLVRVDAAQPPAERYKSFLRCLRPEPVIIIGNRSAVYAPATNLGVIALWDDGDSLLSEPLAPYVHARDAALVRQGQTGAALVFAGYTRTADVERLVATGFVTDLAPRRKTSPKVVLSATVEGERAGSRVPSSAFRVAREAVQHGPVLIQVARPGFSPVLVCDGCRTAARCAHCGGPLSAAARGATPTCRWCARQARGWKCQNCESTAVRLASSGSERTADELGRAFPGVKVIVSDGDHAVTHVDDKPAIIVATRGAEPVARGGYRAVILLDGERMLFSDDLRVGESCLRWWSNAAALAGHGAQVHLVGVTGSVARALATWTQPMYAREQLEQRAPLHMPPTARVGAIEGTLLEVSATLEDFANDVNPSIPDAVIGPVETGEGVTRALVRFTYAEGAASARSFRASVIRAALRTRRAKNAPRTNTLRVRLDVADPQL